MLTLRAAGESDLRRRVVERTTSNQCTRSRTAQDLAGRIFCSGDGEQDRSAIAFLFFTHVIPVQPHAYPTKKERRGKHSAGPAEEEQPPTRCDILMEFLDGHAGPPGVS